MLYVKQQYSQLVANFSAALLANEVVQKQAAEEGLLQLKATKTCFIVGCNK